MPVSTINPSIIQQLQEDVAARLSGNAAFAYVPVVMMNPRSADELAIIESKLDEILMGFIEKDGKSGLAALVLVPEPYGRDPDVPGPQLDIEITVRIVENPLINRVEGGVQVTPDDLALKVLGLLHQWMPFGTNACYADERGALVQVQIKDRIAWDAKVKVSEGLTPITCASMPRITVVDDLVTMTAADGVAIYYTTDGSLPTAATGTLYTVPFALTTPGSVWVRAVGSVSGLADSSPRGLRITVTE